MAIFFTYVLVSGSTKDVKRRVFHLMEPYHNDSEVEEYEAECECDWRREGCDPDCEECGGTGVYLTTWNPMSKLDRYTLWDSLHVLKNASKNPLDWEDQFVVYDPIPYEHDAEAAIAPLSTLDIERLELPQVIVTPCGDRHEMEGDWYSDSRESPDWQEWGSTVKKILTKWPSAILVVLNCHR